MNAVNTIKTASKIKDPDLYNEIVDLDLFGKERKCHTKCCNSFKYRYSSSMGNTAKDPTDYNCLQSNSKFDWEAVKTFINRHVLLEQKVISTGVTVETEVSVQKMQKRALFQYKKVTKGTPNLTSPYVYSLFTIFLIKQIF